MNPFLICVLALFLQACGGGGDEAATCDKPVRIQLFGDSTQWGYLAAGNGTRAQDYPEKVLQELMDERFGEGCVRVTTRAVSGTTSEQLIAGSDGLNQAWPASVEADIVVVNHGVNDVAWGIDRATYKNNMRRLAHAGGVVVVFQTPLPVSTAAVNYAEDARQVAAEEQLAVIDSYSYTKSFVNWWKYAPDGVHGTSEAYKLLTTNVAMPVLAPIVERLLR